jgi:outer membrane protein
MQKTLIATAISAVMLAMLPMTAISHEQGDLIVRVGAATVDPNEDSSLISAGSAGALSGTGAGLNSDTQLGLTVSYMLTNNWAIEVLAATPFEHNVTAQGLGAFAVDTLGTVEHLPPTISLQYYFDNAGSRFHPYAGAGINYTLILDESLSSEAKTGLGATSLEVDDSFGWSVQAGFDYELNSQWMINAAIWYIDIKTDATLKTVNSFNPITADLDIDPWVYMLSAAYKF